MKYVFAVILMTVAFISNAQQAAGVVSRPVEIKEQVLIIDQSNYRSIQSARDFFSENIKKVLLKQISKERIESVQKNCNENDYPECIKKQIIYNSNDPASEDRADKLIKSLHVYRIAKFDNIRNGKNFGEWSILLAPASENKNLGGGCNYAEDFYILMDTKGIKVVK